MQLKKSQNVDIITCPWHPIPENPFAELKWRYHMSSNLTITLQILKLLHTAQQVGQYENVFFLEHDVLYPEGYFDIEPFSEDVLANTNYIGLSESGYQSHQRRRAPLHQLAMRLPAAIEHFTGLMPRLLTERSVMLEPTGRPWATRQSSEPAVHINHGRHHTSHFDTYSKSDIELSHPYWGSADSWWE
jgi:hypothetical protein